MFVKWIDNWHRPICNIFWNTHVLVFGTYKLYIDLIKLIKVSSGTLFYNSKCYKSWDDHQTDKISQAKIYMNYICCKLQRLFPGLSYSCNAAVCWQSLETDMTSLVECFSGTLADWIELLSCNLPPWLILQLTTLILAKKLLPLSNALSRLFEFIFMVMYENYYTVSQKTPPFFGQFHQLGCVFLGHPVLKANNLKYILWFISKTFVLCIFYKNQGLIQ